MKAFVMFLAVAIGAVAAIAASQDAAAAAERTTATGEVVRYDAGKAIVLRHADDRVITYPLSPALVVPEEVQVGRRVSIVREPSSDGTVLVTRVTGVGTTAAEPEGEGAKSEMTTVYGVVTAYEPGRTITVTQPDRKLVTYAIDGESALPPSLARGRSVVVRTVMRPGLERPVVRKVTISKRKSG